MVLSYANSLDCERGAQAAFEECLTRIILNWQHDVVGKNVNTMAPRNLIPCLVFSVRDNDHSHVSYYSSLQDGQQIPGSSGNGLLRSIEVKFGDV